MGEHQFQIQIQWDMRAGCGGTVFGPFDHPLRIIRFEMCKHGFTVTLICVRKSLRLHIGGSLFSGWPGNELSWGHQRGEVRRKSSEVKL